MKKFRSLVAIIAAFSLTTTGCTTINAEVVETEVKAVEAVETIKNVYTDEDKDSKWSKETSTVITLNGSSATVAGYGAAVNGSLVTISAAGTYVLSGTLSDGQIMVDAGKDDLVRIVLNGVSITNLSGTAIYAKKAEKTVLILADGTENAVSDGEVYGDTSEDAPDSAIFVKNDMSITGKGTLLVTGNYNNGISVKDNLVITDGVINVTAKNDGIRGKDSLVIANGQFNITAGNDGLKANNDSNAEKGYIVLDGGVYVIASNSDAIQAETSLTVNGGTYDIKTGGGADNAVVQQNESATRQGGFMNRDGSVPKMPEGMVNGTMTPPEVIGEATVTTATEADEQTAEDETSDSFKGLKAGVEVAINGGEFVIDAEDDGVHSNGNVTITDGTFSIKTGDDGIHADEALLISGSNISIEKCYEGLEGKTVDITGGEIFINASDDAINAAGGSTTSAGGRFSISYENHIRISGGVIEAIAGYDALDANGNIFIEGGTIYANGASQGMDGAVDCDGEFVVTGGTLIGVGSVITPSAKSTQATLIVSHKSNQSSGSVITLKDSNGEVVVEYITQKSYSVSAITSSKLKEGESYQLYSGETKLCDVTLSGIVTTIYDDGSAATNNNRGFGGMNQQQDNMGRTRDGMQRTAPTA